MSASLKAHSTIMKTVRQANPTEDVRRQRVFAWAVTALLICGSPLLGKWQAVIAGWAGKHILLAIDGTSSKDGPVVCRVAVCFRGRAFPLCWRTFDTKSHSVAYARYIAVLEEVSTSSAI
jgi:hypothetical protein